jgi:flagellar protein FlbD
MIKVTKLNGSELVVNADLIEFVESTPDTLISLTTGRKIMVREGLDDVVGKALAYRRSARAVAVPAGGAGSVFDGQPR